MSLSLASTWLAQFFNFFLAADEQEAFNVELFATSCLCVSVRVQQAFIEIRYHLVKVGRAKSCVRYSNSLKAHTHTQWVLSASERERERWTHKVLTIEAARCDGCCCCRWLTFAFSPRFCSNTRRAEAKVLLLLLLRLIEFQWAECIVAASAAAAGALRASKQIECWW